MLILSYCSLAKVHSFVPNAKGNLMNDKELVIPLSHVSGKQEALD